MRTFQLVNGDFVLGPGGYATISGGHKVVQDLGAVLREPIGTDRFHPKWGSVLDDFIGTPIGFETQTRVRSEVHRVIQNYMVVQADRMERDANRGDRQQVRPEEVVVGINAVDIQQRTDRLNVRISLETASGDTHDILRTVT